MNTEFPSRVPTIQNTTSTKVQQTTSVSTSTTTQSDFEKTLLTIFRNSVKTLNEISDFVSTLPDKLNRNKKSTKIESKKNEEITAELKEIRRDNKKEADIDNKIRVSFFSGITKILTRVRDSWSDSVRSIQNTIESSNGRIGSAIGAVFGSGIIGNTIGNVITKALNLFASKILLGMVIKNIPTLLKLGALIYLVTRFIKHSSTFFNKMSEWGEKLYEAINYISTWFRQKVDKVKSWFGLSNYDAARKGLADAYGVSEDKIVETFGADAKGKERMLNAWKKLSANKNYKDNIESFQLVNNVSPTPKKTNDFLARLSDGSLFKPSTVYNQSIVNNYNSVPEDAFINKDLLFGEAGEKNYTPIPVVNNVNSTNTAISPMPAENVASMYPQSSINDMWGGYSPIPAGMY